jgi:hypothetical protein
VNDDWMDGFELFELEPPPHDTRVAIAAPHATTPNTSSRDFMKALLVLSKGRSDH